MSEAQEELGRRALAAVGRAVVFARMIIASQPADAALARQFLEVLKGWDEAAPTTTAPPERDFRRRARPRWHW